jgi:hypothetical protein
MIKNKPQYVVTGIVCFVVLAGIATRSQASLVFYDIANSQFNQRSLNPSYVGSSQSEITASSLYPSVGLRNNHSKYDMGAGEFVFGDWSPQWWDPTSGFIEFDLTAVMPLRLNTMSYTFFSGIWNSMDGPHYLDVLASKDGFATSINIHSRNLAVQWPDLFCPNNFVDDLTSIGTINTGETVAIRFYAYREDYSSIPAGLWNRNAGNYNLMVDFTVPEPATLSLLALGGMILSRRTK